MINKLSVCVTFLIIGVLFTATYCFLTNTVYFEGNESVGRWIQKRSQGVESLMQTCDHIKCVEDLHMYPDPNAGCECKYCCYTTDIDIANANFQPICKKYDLGCETYPRWSICPGRNARFTAPTGTPPSVHCTQGKNTTDHSTTEDGFSTSGPLTTEQPIVPITTRETNRNSTNVMKTNKMPTWGIITIPVCVVLIVICACIAMCIYRHYSAGRKNSSSRPSESCDAEAEQDNLLSGGPSVISANVEDTIRSSVSLLKAENPSDDSNNFEYSTAALCGSTLPADSGFGDSVTSTPSSLRSFGSKVSHSVDASIKAINEFVWNKVKDWHQELKDSCDSKQAWLSALQAEAVDEHEITLDILPAVMATNPFKIVEAFSSMPGDDDVQVKPREGYQDFVWLLHLIKNCKRFHELGGKDKGTTLREAIDKISTTLKVSTSMSKEAGPLTSLCDVSIEEDISIVVEGLKEHLKFPQIEADTPERKVSIEAVQQGQPSDNHEMKVIREDVHLLKRAFCSLNTDVCSLNTDVCSMKTDVCSLKTDQSSLGARVTKLESGTDIVTEWPQAPELTRFSFKNRAVLFIKWNKEGYKNLCRVIMTCSTKTCRGCTTPEPYSLPSTPMALSFHDLEPGHCYKLQVDMNGLKRELVVMTKANGCTKTLGDVCDDSIIFKLDEYIDQQERKWCKQNLCCLLGLRDDDLRYLESQKEYERHCLLQMILEKQSDFPVAMLMYCLFYCGLYKAAETVADWHGDCPVCKDLYREIFKLVKGST